MGVAPRSVLPRRFRQRLPVRVRQNGKLLTGCVAFLVVLTVLLGTERIRPFVIGVGDTGRDPVSVDVAGTVDLFDAGRAHTFALTFRDADYERMLDEYWKEGEKGYVEADLTVDGTTIPSVGIRLKGNSTLRQLTWKGETRPLTDDEGGGPPAGGFPAAGQQQAGDTGQPADGTAQQDGRRGGRPPGGPASTTLKAEEPETLPWLVSFDEFVEGRRYQGHREVTVRVGGMGGGATVLNEALSLALLDAAGEVAQRYAYSSFRVNDRPTTARLLVEHPDEHFADRIDGTGVLYKSLATSSFTDQGDDPTAYADDFTQVTMKGSQDLQPVMNLIRWVNSADDEEFDAHLADRVDVASFARYVAAQNLLLNFDDMAGPGRNYYLWYDLGTKKFRVISWDHNLTFSGSADQGPHDSAGFGPGLGPRLGPAPGQDGTTPGRSTGEDQAAQPPAGMQPPAGVQPPAGMQPPGGEDATGDATRGGARGGMTTGHRLKERFLASAAFKGVYEDAYRELYQQIYASGTATRTLDAIGAVVRTVDGADAATVDSDVARLRTLIAQRTESLADDEVITRS
ncbi:CotH kinase family protein [Micromonospora coxensis]|uniref:CotH kinase family protein n=1 Tax=Micromonospora coxensis TaxID=356852 RepID=UPI003434E952